MSAGATWNGSGVSAAGPVGLAQRRLGDRALGGHARRGPGSATASPAPRAGRPTAGRGDHGGRRARLGRRLRRRLRRRVAGAGGLARAAGLARWAWRPCAAGLALGLARSPWRRACGVPSAAGDGGSVIESPRLGGDSRAACALIGLSSRPDHGIRAGRYERLHGQYSNRRGAAPWLLIGGGLAAPAPACAATAAPHAGRSALAGRRRAAIADAREARPIPTFAEIPPLPDRRAPARGLDGLGRRRSAATARAWPSRRPPPSPGRCSDTEALRPSARARGRRRPPPSPRPRRKPTPRPSPRRCAARATPPPPAKH